MRQALRRLGALAPALAIGAVLALLLASPWRGVLDAPAYDALAAIAPPPPASDIVVVAIDEPSFAEIGQRWPWPRSLHADLVRAARAAGARTIGLDIVFAEPSSPEADRALAEALGPEVTLAADFTVIDTPHARQSLRIDPLPEFLDREAEAGIAAVSLDRDGALRRAPAYDDAFARMVARAAGATPGPVPDGALIRFRGGPRTYRTVSYYQALEPDKFLPPGALKDAVVLVGLSTQTAAGAGAADAFATPFTARTGRWTAGVEAQATMVDGWRSGDVIRQAPLWTEFAALGLAIAAGAGLARGGRVTLRAALSALGLAVVAVVASWIALRYGGWWLSPVAMVLALAAVVGLDAAIDYARERRARKEIARAFGQYLAPELVERLARDPAALKLGGEVRVITVLFCDVRGFTTIAERLKDDPERLTSLVNRLLQPLSDAVFAEGGTIDKYIGDCVMAFWNAPLDTPDHAERAVAAGLRMLAAIEALNAELAAEPAAGAPPLVFGVGVGINTGACVVGNLGCDRRFDYSAIGDAVNLASRLESASRFYGVSMLIGEDTAAAAQGRFALLELDRLAVKGRASGTAVYAVLPAAHSEAAARVQAAFLAAYRAGDWDAADAALGRLSSEAPELGVYAVRMAERVARLRAEPPPADWNGVFAAAEK
ncbi:CHASE2 domain-containing protein [Methylopila turkensis]|uniref:Adenylate/guanylate cyclase domain-containing protein n=1 Tax=Methylopila turkensis TaxID=1437816 RepID=A0A9W6N8B7_9HYPH|nr:adenylate/guanylate cyclase domain-containing protein [Methylopila turkensis]GLK81282.1 adenylate/guanylate cyclase domain-containing protein [Methylopila turkensis]